MGSIKLLDRSTNLYKTAEFHLSPIFALRERGTCLESDLPREALGV